MSSIARSAQIMTCIANGGNRLSDISRKLKLGNSTVHRILKALVNTGFIVFDQRNKKYYLGPLIFDLSNSLYDVHMGLILNTKQEMRRLNEITRETIILYIEKVFERICIDQIESVESLKYTVPIGHHAPIYVGAGSKVMLASFSVKKLDAFFNQLALTPLASNTITERERLLAELQIIKDQGYGQSISEITEGAASFAVPIRNYCCPAAIGILGPTQRIIAKKDRLLAELKISQSVIEENLKKILGTSLSMLS